jgi:hypothetical protein
MAKCSFCKKQFTQFNSLNKVCSIKCAIELGKLKPAKVNYKRVNSQLKSELKKQNTDYGKLLQKKVQHIARIIDKGLPCLATGTNGQIHGGHIYARGGNKNIKYNLHNIHRQSAHSNHYQTNDVKMQEGIIREYGKEYLEFINELKQTKLIKYSSSELEAMNEIANKIIREFKDHELKLTTKERIEYRNKFNSDIGISNKMFILQH